MVNQDEEGVPYDDPSGDEQRQNPQPNPQQADLNLNATANGSQESAGRNAETDGAQNGQLNSSGDRSGGRRSTSAFDRLGPGNSEPRPFGGIGSDPNQIMQDLRHRMQAMELEVKELRKENTELKNVAQDLKTRRRSPRNSSPRRRERSRSHSPTERRLRSPPEWRRHWNSSESRDSSSDESHEGRRRRPHR
ncbi:hypothetical protein PIB30_008195 [Stylosanthes scabra]|uniref:Uncharacterized protein n=1 Tax=Stylosanthes scabra TaxID=79078 RepID=A0ABU6Z2M8_9FABA|nr:hypothetical protein [Stylosanthes scabra]